MRLYPEAYRLKFFGKKELGRDYVVMPLEIYLSDARKVAAEKLRTILRQPVSV